MKLPTSLVLLVAVIGVANAQERPVDQQISEALMPLPQHMRAGATVIGYDATGKEVLLRRGTSNFTCTADSPANGFSVRCFPNIIADYRARVSELLAAGTSEDELRDIVDAEIKSGKLRLPDRAVSYAIRGAELQNALPLMVIYLPGATAESTGLSTVPNHYRPWLMFAGTSAAHVMIPGK